MVKKVQRELRQRVVHGYQLVIRVAGTRDGNRVLGMREYTGVKNSRPRGVVIAREEVSGSTVGYTFVGTICKCSNFGLWVSLTRIHVESSKYRLVLIICLWLSMYAVLKVAEHAMDIVYKFYPGHTK